MKNFIPYSIFISVFLISELLFADPITVIIGSSANNSTDLTITPYKTYYHDGQDQWIFTADELNDAGLGAGFITEIGWNVSSAASQVLNGLTISMQHTTLSTFSSFVTTGWNQCYSGNIAAVTGWNMYTFSSNFNWDGVSNLLIKFCFDNASWTSSSSVYYSATTDNKHAYFYNDNNTGCNFTGTTVTGYNTSRANIKITGEQYNTPLPPNCALLGSPINTGTEIFVSTSLNWSSGGGGTTGYKLFLGTDNPPVDILNGVDLGDITTYDPIGDLDYSQTYFWKVVPYNGNGDATDCPVWSFSTRPDPTIISFPYCESFDGIEFSPYGWTNLKTAGSGNPGTWDRQTTGTYPTCAPHTGEGMARYSYYYDGTKGLLITPPINLPNDNFKIKFWFYRDGTNYLEYMDLMNVYYNTDPNTIGSTMLGTINRSIQLIPVVPQTGWYEYEFQMPAGASGDGRYVIFEGVSNYGNNMFLDDVCIEESLNPPLCELSVSPLNLASNVLIFTNLNWTNSGGAEGFKLYFGTDDPPANLVNGADLGNVTTFDPPLNLNIYQTYYWKVVPYNGNGDAPGCPVWSFTTGSDPTITSFPYCESFDGTTFGPYGWTNLKTSGTSYPGTWDRQTAGTTPTCTTHTGAGMARYNCRSISAGTQSILVTPPINFPGDNYRVKFWFYRDGTAYLTLADLINVYFNTQPNATGATLLGTINRSIQLTPFIAATGWYEYEFQMPTGSSGNGKYVIFEAVSAYGNNMFLDDVCFEEYLSNPPSCALNISPADLANNGLVSATLNWSSGGGGTTGYKLFFGTDNPPTDILNGVDLGDVTTFDPIGNLDYSQTYYWKVVPYNGNGDASECPVWSFSTRPNPTITSFPYCESFDGTEFAPYGWINMKTAGTGNPGTWDRQTVGSYPTCAPHTGAGMASYNSFGLYAGTQGILVTPPINFLSDNYKVKFWFYRDGTNYLTYADRIIVYYNTAPNTTGATLLGTINRSIQLTPVVATTGWYEYEFQMPTGSFGDGRYVIFEALSAYGNNIFLDDVCLEEITAPNCAIPVSPANLATNVLATTNLNWTSGGGIPLGYKLYFGTDNPPTNIVNGDDLGSTNTYDPSPDLNIGQTYYWKIVPYNLSGEASNCDVWSFTIYLCPPVSSFPFIEDFEDGIVPPACWSEIITNPNDNWQPFSYYNGAYCPGGNYPQDEWLLSPVFDFSSQTSPLLSFKWNTDYNEMVSPNNNGDYYCKIRFDNNANWTQLWSEEDEGYFNWSFYKTKVIDLSEYGGYSNVQVAFQLLSFNTVYNGVWIEDFTISSEPVISLTPFPWWQNIEGSFTSGSNKIYKIPMTAGRLYNFSICSNDNIGGNYTGTGNGDFTLYSDAALSSEIWHIDGNPACGNNATTIGSSQQDFSPSVTQEYYLKVYDPSNLYAGSYSLAYQGNFITLPAFAGTCQTVEVPSFAAGSGVYYKMFLETEKDYNFSTCSSDACGGSAPSNNSDFHLYNSYGTLNWIIDGLSDCGYDASTYGQLQQDYTPSSSGYYYLYIYDNNGIASSGMTLAYLRLLPSCALNASPPDLSNDVLVTTTLNWASGGGGPTGYKLFFGTDNPPTNIVNGNDLGNVTTFDPTGELSYSQTYYWKVVPYNLDGNASECQVWSFTTAPDPTIAYFPYYESFDATTFEPYGWTNLKTAGTGNPGTWNRQTTGTSPTCTPHTGAGMTRYNSRSYSAGTKGILVTPPINFPDDNYRVKFWFYRDGTAYLTYTDRINVYYNTAPNTTGATLLGTINRSIQLTPVVTNTGWYEYKFQMPAGSSGNGKYVILEAVSAYGNNVFLDDVCIEDNINPPLCATNVSPTDLSNNILVTTTLNWASGGGEPTGYKLFLGTDNPPTNIANGNDLGNVTTFDPIGELSYSQTFYWKVVPYNLDGNATECPVWSFTTVPDPTIASFPYCESFDATTFAPYGWTNLKTAGTGNPGTWDRQTVGTRPTCTPHTGAGMARYNSYNFASGTQGILVTPPVNFPGNNYRVKFWFYRDGTDYLTLADRLNVYYNSVPNKTGAILLGTINRSITLPPVVATAGWYNYEFCMPEGSLGNGKYVVFEAVSAFGNNMFLDDVCIEENIDPPTCALIVSPGDLESDVLHTTLLNWKAGECAPTGYKLYLGTDNPPTNIVNGQNLGTNTIYDPSPDLAFNQTYFWKIVPYNANIDASDCPVWSFTTGPDPTISSFPLCESFDGTTLTAYGWTNLKTSGSGNPGTWDQQTAGTYPPSSPHTGTGMARYNSFNLASGTKGILATPPLNIPDDNYKVKFWFYRDGTGYLTNTDRINVYYNTEPNTIGSTLLETVNRSIQLEPVVTETGWYLYEFQMPEGVTGNGRYVIFEALSDYGNNMFLDDFCFEEYFSDPPSCALNISPGDLIDNVLITATLNWASGGGGPTGYKLFFGTDNPPSNLVNGDDLSDVTTYNPIGDLDYSQTYYWKVIPYNNNGDANECPVWSFTTLPDPTISIFPYCEGFDGTTFAPNGWTNLKTSGTINPGTWNRETSGTHPDCSPHSGIGMARYYSYIYPVGTKAVLITPPINFPDDNYKVSFWFYRDGTGYITNTDLINVYCNTSPSTTGSTLLGTINRSIQLAPVVAATGWYLYEFQLPTGTSGEGRYVILEAVSDYGNNMFLDDFCIEEHIGVPNDFCTNAISVSYGDVVTGSTTFAFMDYPPVCTWTFTSPGVWYKFTGTGLYTEARLCSANTSYDSKISVYSGTCNSLVCVTADDDGCDYPDMASKVMWLAENGTDYYILVHGYSSNKGNFELTIDYGPLSLQISASQSEICQGSSSQLYAIPSGGHGNYSFLWSSDPPGFSSTLQNPVVSPLVTTNYNVIVSDGFGSVTSSTMVLVYLNEPPSTISNMLPSDGSLLPHPSVTFSWQPATNVSKYDLYIWEISSPEPTFPTISNISEIQYTSYWLDYGTSYYWKIIAKNPCFQTSSLVQSFEVVDLPDLIVTNIQVPANPSTGQMVEISWSVLNQGNFGTQNKTWYDGIYLSQDNVLDLSFDTYLAGKVNLTSLPANTAYNQLLTVMLPEDIFGNNYLIVKTDYNNKVYETSNVNNYLAQQIDIALTPPPDLEVTSTIIPTIAFSGETINVQWTTTNTGTGEVYNKTWVDKIYLSQQPVFNLQTATFLGQKTFNQTLPPNSNYAGLKQVNLPGNISGSYYIYIYTDANDNVFEHANENNNIFQSQIFEIVLTPPPDLTVIDIQHPLSASNNELTIINWTLKNQGASPTLNYWKDRIYLCPEPFLNEAIAIGIGIKSHYIVLQPGETYTTSMQITAPFNISGQYYLFVYTDYLNQVFEHLNESNNIVASENLLEIKHADLTVIDPVIPATALSGQSIMVNWKVENIGTGTVLNKTITDKVFLSQSNVFPIIDPIVIGSLSYSNTIYPNTPLQKSKSVTIPDGLEGQYYLFICTNTDLNVYENQLLDNNHAVGSIFIDLSPYPDLTFDDITFPNSIELGSSENINYTVINDGDANIFGKTWRDALYASFSPILDTNTAVKLSDHQINQPLNMGNSYSINSQITLPVNAFKSLNQGYLHCFTEFNNNVFEKHENNNIATSLSIPFTLPPKVDLLIASSAISTNTIQSGQNVNIIWTVKNISTPTNIWGIEKWYDAVYLSTDTIPGTDDILISEWEINMTLATNSTYSESRSVTVPDGLSGDYFFLIVTDHTKLNDDLNYVNNSRSITGSVPVYIIPTLYPDLEAVNLNCPMMGTAGQPFRFVWQVSNIGVGPTYSSWTDKIYLSTDFNIDANDINVATKANFQILNVNNNYKDSMEVFLPNNISGNYIVIFKTDANNNMYESGQGGNNNFAYAGLNIIQSPSSDLIVSDISFPASIEIGQSATIQYEVKNIGENPATGYMKDILYFSTDSAWNFNDPKFGIKDNNINIAPLMTQSCSLTAAIPGLLPGDYFVAVQTNVLNNIPEVNMDNNTGISGTKISVTMPQLVLGVEKSDVLSNEIGRYYEIEIPQPLENETMLISLKGDSINGVNELYLSLDSIPTRSSHTFSATEPFKGNQELIVPEVEAGKYYLLVYGSTTNGNSQEIKLLADILPFEIRSINADQGGNSGNVTVLIQGAKFENNMLIKLSDNSLGTYVASSFFLVNSTKLFATFNLNNAGLGVYDVIAEKPGNTSAILADGFEIVQGSSGNSTIDTTGFVCYIENIGYENLINTNIEHPATSRPNWIIAITIHFENTGNVDIPVPGSLLVSLTGVPLTFNPYNFTENLQELYIEFEEYNGPPGILRPGAQGTITVYAKSDSIGTKQFALTY